MKVERAMRAVNTLLPAGMTVQAALDQIIGSGEETAVVRHETSLGLVSQAELRAAIENGNGDQPLALLLNTLGRSLTSSTNLAHVHSDQSLSVALQRMGKSRCDVLPVVGREDIRVVVGAITLDDILEEYGVRR